MINREYIERQVKLIDLLKQLLPLSWHTRPMINYVKEHTNSSTSLIGVEIGVDLGLNSKNIMNHLNIKKLYLIDPYSGVYSRITGNERYNTAKRRLKKYEQTGKVIWKIMTSEKAAMEVPNDLDFVYIDGDHSKEGVKKDLLLWYPKVKPGGTFGGHDFCGSAIGVIEAVVEFTQQQNLKLYGNINDWWVIKPL